MRAFTLLILLLAVAEARAESCIQCHGDQSRLMDLTKQDTVRTARAFVDLEKAQQSVHGTQSCDDCHFEFARYPHPKKTETAGCADCHEDAAAQHATSAHQGDKVSCADCHGTHDILKSDTRESRLHPLNVTRTCGTCHFDDIDAATATTGELLATRFCDDTHGVGLLRAPPGLSASRVERDEVARA